MDLQIRDEIPKVFEAKVKYRIIYLQEIQKALQPGVRFESIKFCPGKHSFVGFGCKFMITSS